MLNRSRLVRLAGGDLEKSARAAGVTGASGGQLTGFACTPVIACEAAAPDPIDAILQRTFTARALRRKFQGRRSFVHNNMWP